MDEIKEKALEYLRTALSDSDAEFRDGQWDCISQVLANKRVLVVQRTGWGKSMVYFLATKLLREQGRGLTLLVSPLLSLMRNQIEAAERIGIRAETINSDNTDDWDAVKQKILNDQVDVLLISPERLANESFVNDILSPVAARVGLFVVDEAHCISDWGHDFRPDYRRIVRVILSMPSNVPVLATTATANNRVVSDIKSQIGDALVIIRGTLVRKSLYLQHIEMPGQAERMAWLAQAIPRMQGCGIVYTLTQRDAMRVAKWLRSCGIDAKEYHADVSPCNDMFESLKTYAAQTGLDFDEANTSGVYKHYLEQQLLKNELKVLVATVALGMGFDKPDLTFVIHYQRPASVVHYYQQVGRAGRACENAYGVLLCGEEDDQISDYFIKSAFPPQKHVDAVLKILMESASGLSTFELQRTLNLKVGQIEKTLKFLTVESPSPVVKIKSKWMASSVAINYRIDHEKIEKISLIRRDEQSQMREYMQHDGCLMAFLQNALDDPSPASCGKCLNCQPSRALPTQVDGLLVQSATMFLKKSYLSLEPRKLWPTKGAFPVYGFSGKITEDLRSEEGRALCLWNDSGWGRLVVKGKYETNRFDDELVDSCAEMLAKWKPEPSLEWVACIPSNNPDHGQLVPDFAKRLAGRLGLPFCSCIEKIKDNKQQKHMENSFQQALNLDGVFRVVPEQLLRGSCLLIDDIVDSKWTFTVAVALLRQAGCSNVFPMALAMNSPRMD